MLFRPLDDTGQRDCKTALRCAVYTRVSTELAWSIARARAVEIEARVAEAARAASPVSNRQGRHALHQPKANGRGASTDSPAVRPSDDDATVRAAIERVVLSWQAIDLASLSAVSAFKGCDRIGTAASEP